MVHLLVGIAALLTLASVLCIVLLIQTERPHLRRWGGAGLVCIAGIAALWWRSP